MRGIRADYFTVEEWLKKVNSATAQLPEFQRDVVWKSNSVTKFLQAILENRPVGCLLVLKVKPNTDAPFDPRPIEGANPSSNNSIEYLILDGQQRITALWNALVAEDQRTKYFITYSESTIDSVVVVSLTGNRVPKSPKKCLERGLIPLSLLRFSHLPDEKKNVTDWINEAISDNGTKVDYTEQDKIGGWIAQHSENLRNFAIPHITMPDNTTESQAIETFIQSNSSALNLKKFDIVTAVSLAEKNPNLRTSRERTWDDLEELQNYIDLPTVGDLLLKVGCLRSNRSPIQNHYGDDDVLEDVANNLNEIIDGIRWVIELLHDENIFDRRRLPTIVPFRVLPALYRELPEESYKRGAVNKTIRAYLWRAFLSDRYKSTAATNLKEDFDGLSSVIRNDDHPTTKIPIWNSNLPTFNQIQQAHWPTLSTFPKALLAISIRRGGQDIGTGDRLKMTNLKDREYHHIFPEAYLKENAPEDNPHVAMNCVLIRGRTNREAYSKPPLEYLESLIVKYAGSTVDETELKSRLNSNLVPFAQLKIGKKTVSQQYREFLKIRSKLFEDHIEKLVDGQEPPILTN